MKRICRNLSIALGVVLGAILVVILFRVFNKSNNKTVYAESINFTTKVGSFNVIIDNALILNDNIVEITPTNCAFKPIFTIKLDGSDEETLINGNCYIFDTLGKHALIAKVQSGDNHYIKDSIYINVTNTPSENTSMYIGNLLKTSMKVGDKLDINTLLDIKYPTSANLKVECNDNIEVAQNQIIAINEGMANINVYITYDNITISKNISFNIKPKEEIGDIELILWIDNEEVDCNNVQIEYSPTSTLINYELTNLGENQDIYCWTESNIIQVSSYFTPTIIIKPLSTGEAVVHIRSLHDSNVEFDIIISII